MSRDGMEQAFWAVKAAVPHASIERWRSFAASILDDADGRAGGIMVAESRRGHVRGLLAWRVEQNLEFGRTLGITLLVLPGLGRKLTAELLYEVACGLATAQGCTGMHIALSAGSDWETDFFQAKGHCVTGWILGRASAETVPREV